jgi:predicted MFS family arabinose efflux permease
VLLQWFSWRSVFVAGAAGALVAGVAALLLAPETRDTHRSPFDVRGAVCTALAPAALVYALIEGNDGGWVRPRVVTALAVTMLAIAAYVVLGLRTEHPLLDPRLFRIAGFGTGTATIAVQFMAVFGFYFVGLQYLQLVLGYSALRSAVALVPVAVVIVLVSEATPGLATRLGERTVVIGGLLLLGSGLAAMSLLDTDSGYLPFLGGLVVAGLGIGMTGVVGTSAITGSLSRDQQGVASAMNDITREVGAAVGIALMGSVFGSHYRRALPDVSHLPPAAADAVRHSPVGGLYVADRLGPRGAVLGASVKDAFTKGMSAALIAAAVVIAAAVCFLLPSPNKRRSTALAETTAPE